MSVHHKLFLISLLSLTVSATPIKHQTSLSSPAAYNYSSLVVFGDSFSDNGNGSYKFSNGTWPPSYYYQGRFSNGPVWNEYLADNLSIPLYNHAVGGSTTANSIIQGYTGNHSVIPVPSTDERVETFLNDIPPGFDYASALFAVTGGVNDIFFDPNASAFTSMSIIAESVGRLQKAGAQNFLFFNYYDVSMIPYDTYIEPDVKHKNEEWSANFQGSLEHLQESTPGSYLFSLDADLFPHLYYYGEPTDYGFDQLGAYGSCVTGAYHETPNFTICDDPYRKVFWDEYHPSTHTHSLIAASILQMLQGS